MLRIGFIGCGGNMRIAHVPPLANHPRAALRAVADPDPAAREAVLAAYRDATSDIPRKRRVPPPTAYDSDRAMLVSEELDAVLISTPHAHHFAQAKRALLRNLHVHIEKPITTRSSDARKLAQLARTRARLLSVNYQRVFFPHFVHARELIQQRAIGDVVAVNAHVTQAWNPGSSWRGDPKLAGGGFFMDTGSHLVSIVLWLTQFTPADVSARTDNHGARVDRTALLSVHFHEGAWASLAFFGTTQRHDETITLHGTQGTLSLRAHQWRQQTTLLNDEPLPTPKRLVREQSPDTAFYDAIAQDRTDLPGLETAIQTIILSEAAYRSALKRGAVVRLPARRAATA